MVEMKMPRKSGPFGDMVRSVIDHVIAIDRFIYQVPGILLRDIV